METHIFKFIFLCLILLGLYDIYPSVGYKLLKSAVKTNEINQVDFFLKMGVPANPNDDVKKWYFETSLQESLLHEAVKNNNLKTMKLLIDKGANVNSCCCSCIAPLHLAILGKNEQVTKLLLKSGASINLRYDAFLTPLQLAKKYSTPEIVQLVKSYEND